MNSPNGWVEYKRLVLEKLDALDGQFQSRFKSLHDQVTQLRIDVAVLKVRAGIWGALAGTLTVGIPLLVWLFMHHFA